MQALRVISSSACWCYLFFYIYIQLANYMDSMVMSQGINQRLDPDFSLILPTGALPSPEDQKIQPP